MPGSLPRLIVRDVSGGQHEVEISRTPFSMGRLSDNDLVLLDGRVSRHHARIIQGELGYLIEDTESGMLFLREESGELRLRVARGRGGIFLSTKLADYSHSVVERVVRYGREEVVLEEENTGRAPQETGIISGDLRGVVALPLQKSPMVDIHGDTLQGTVPELLGVLYLDSRARAGALTGLDRQVLQSLAGEGATAIENARPFRVTREQEGIR